MEITRELDKESLLNCYPIYISYRQSVLLIINPILKSIYCPLSSSQMVDLVFLHFTFYFHFHFVLFSYFFQNIGLELSHKTQRTKQKDLEQMMLYNMDTICWPYVLHMVVQDRVYSSEHGLLVVVYKIDQFVERSLSSSLVLLNTRVILLSNPKGFSS